MTSCADPGRPARTRSAASFRLGTLWARMARRSVVVQVARSHLVDHDPADREPVGAQLADAVGGLLHGHLLEHRHQVNGGPRRPEEGRDRVGLALDRAHPGEAGELVVDAEELGDPPGRGRVEHDRVVGDRALVAGVAPGRLVDLAGEQDVADAGGDRGRELHHPEPVERLPGPAQLVVHRQVLQQGRLRVDVQGVDDSAAAAVRPGQPGGDPALGVGQRLDVEHPGDPLPPLDLAQQHVLPGSGQRQGEGGGDRGLPGPALAGDDVQAHVGEVAACHDLERPSRDPR